MEKAINAKNLYEFDSNITIKFYGFPTVDTYYRKIGSINEILNVKVPLLCLSANDDDIAHEKALPRDESSANPNIILMETDRGSHVVWLEGNNPFKMTCWFPKPACEFLDYIIKELDWIDKEVIVYKSVKYIVKKTKMLAKKIGKNN